MAAPNPFLTDDEDEDDTQAGTADNPNFKQLRDYAKKLERENNSLKKETDTLKGFQTTVLAERRQAEASKVFGEVGLSKSHAALYFKLNPDGDVTTESVASFAQEFELPVQSTATVDVPDGTAGVTEARDWTRDGIVDLQPETKQSDTKVAGFAPSQPAGPATARIITDIEEATKLMAVNPQEYVRLRQAGRIKLEGLPGSGNIALPGAS